MKTRIVWVIAISFLIISFFAPSLIQILYSIGEEMPINLSGSFQQADILDFWGSALGALGTVFLGALAFFQNKVLKEENDIAQERLNNAANKLANANDIIAENNTKLLILEEENQRIQLLLAQKFIPFLEYTYINYKVNECVETPITSSYKIRQTKYEKGGEFQGQKYKRVIWFEIEIIEKSVLNHYCSMEIQLILSNNTDAKIAVVEFTSIDICSTVNNKKEFPLLGNNEITPMFQSSDQGEYNINIIISDDYLYLLNNENLLLTLEFIMTTTTGISFTEIIEVKINHPKEKYYPRYKIISET